MEDPRDTTRCYIVGSTTEPQELQSHLPTVDGTWLESWNADGGEILLLEASARHADSLAERLGPNAQVLDNEQDARRVAEAASTRPEGAPYEGRHGRMAD